VKSFTESRIARRLDSESKFHPEFLFELQIVSKKRLGTSDFISEPEARVDEDEEVEFVRILEDFIGLWDWELGIAD
jgi:hypothetical protein